MSEKPTANIAILPQLRKVLETLRPDLGNALYAVIDPVTEKHVDQVRTQLASAALLDDDALRDDLPEVLRTMADAFVGEKGIESFALCGPAHASAREGQRFSLEEVLGEYVLVRCSLWEHVVKHLRRPLHDGEAEAFHLAMDALIAATATSFTAQREARLKLEYTALRDFVNSLAHDVRNEISGVMTSVQLLQETATDIMKSIRDDVAAPLLGRMEELVQDVGDCRSTMESSVNAMTRLLEVERLQATPAPRSRDVALLPLMQGVVRSTSRSLRERSHPPDRGAMDLVRVTCPTELIVCTDPDLLGTVLINLVGNAIKHAPQGEIQFNAIPLPDGHHRIEVRDQGPGIPPEHLPKLFGRFQRGAGPTGGTGLGLFIAHRAAQLLGSPITATSEPGRGSCFSIELPPQPPALQPASPA